MMRLPAALLAAVALSACASHHYEASGRTGPTACDRLLAKFDEPRQYKPPSGSFGLAGLGSVLIGYAASGACRAARGD